MSRSAIYTVNETTQAVAVDGTLNLGNIIRRFGCSIDLLGNAININNAGYYDINVSVTAEPTAIGTVTVSLFDNGVEVPGATASEAVAAANTPANLSLSSIVRVFCNERSSNLTLVLTGTAANVTNVAITAIKL